MASVEEIVREEVRAALQEWQPPTPAVEQPLGLLYVESAAARLGVAPQRLLNWRTARTAPPAAKVGRLVKYRAADLDQWIKDQGR